MTEIPKPEPNDTNRERLEDPLPLGAIMPEVVDALDAIPYLEPTSIEPAEVNGLLMRQSALLHKPSLTHEEDLELQSINDRLASVANGSTQPNIDED